MAAPAPIRDVLQSIGQAIARQMLRRLDATGPLRSGSPLAKSLLAGISVQGGETPAADARLRQIANDYAEWVDTGRRPGARKVPLAALLLFIKSRQLRGRDRRTGHPLTPNQLAFLMQRAIFKNGLRGRHFLEPAFALGQELVDLYLNNELLDGLTYELDQQLISL